MAFFANLADGSAGIYLGNGGAGTRVIGTGDSLFGSTVSSVTFGKDGLNDAGQFAVNCAPADGRTGIAVAIVPEPASALLLSIGAIGIFFRRRYSRGSRQSR